MPPLAAGRPRLRLTATATAVAAALALLAACGDKGPTTPKVIPVASLRLAVSADTLEPGEAHTLAAQPLDAQGTPLVRPVTYAVEPAGVATVDAGGTVTAVAPGTATLTAASEGRTATVALAVIQVPVASVAFAAAVGGGLVLNEGDQQTQPARVTDAKQRVRVDRPVTYASSDATVATVDASGTVTARAPGQATITATAETQAAQYGVTVHGLAAALYPTALTATPGATGRLWAQLRTDAGARIAARTAAYESSDPAVVTVASDGTFRTVGVGTATLRATLNGKVATSAVTVQGDVPVTYPITFQFFGPVSDATKDAVRWAADRWQRVIVQPSTAWRPTRQDSLQANVCLRDQAQPYQGDWRGLVIYVVADSLNDATQYGGTVAMAGPCIFRRPSNTSYDLGLPAVGVIHYDTTMQKRQLQNFGADAPRMVRDVFMHEMGHVIGVGVTWNVWAPDGGRRLTDTSSTDPRYLGPGGLAGSAALGFQTGATVPLEDKGGSGTKGAHWRLSEYGREILTGYVQTGGMPLSLLTVRSLVDLGYTVNEAAADPTTAADLNPTRYGPASPLASLAASLDAPFTGRPALVRYGLASIPLEGHEGLLHPRPLRAGRPQALR